MSRLEITEIPTKRMAHTDANANRIVSTFAEVEQKANWMKYDMKI